MKEVLGQIYSKLTADTTLKNLLGYTSSNKNIRRFSSLKEYTFDKYLLFGKLAFEKSNLDSSAYKIKTGQLQMQALDNTSDINCLDIIERAIEVLNDVQLSVAEQMRSLQLEWANSLPVIYDNDINYYIKVAYFDLKIVILS